MEVKFRVLTSALLLAVGCSGLVDFKPGYQYQYEYAASTTLKQALTVSTSAKEEPGANCAHGDLPNKRDLYARPICDDDDVFSLYQAWGGGWKESLPYELGDEINPVFLGKGRARGKLQTWRPPEQEGRARGELRSYGDLPNKRDLDAMMAVFSLYRASGGGWKEFSFNVSNSGEILEVQYPENEKSSAVLQKKALLGTFSSRLHASLQDLKHGGIHQWRYLVNETGHEDLPEMHTFSSGKMELTDVIPIPTEKAQFKVPDNLIKDTLYITEYPKIRFSLDAVSREIMGNLTCMREVRPVYARERIKCFQQLVSIMNHLEEMDLSKVADKYIQFPTRDSNTTEDMHAIIDAFGAAALNETQKILTERILLKKPPDADDEDTKEITTMATLLLGSLAGSLKSTNPVHAERLVARMETELQLHDPQKHRTIRSAETETYENHHEQRKATLLLSLGNAGLDRSYHHILSYINTTDSPQLLRRRGAAAIANYHHEDAASMLLSIALDNNHEDHVRYDALLEYRRHPKAVPISDIQYHLVRGLTNITGLNKRDHSRLKRGIFDGIKFKLQLPGYEWNKQVGSSKIGANFGLTIRNIMDLDIAPLKGRFKIDVLDEAYAVANIGILGIHQDLARVRFCFRGHIKYEINILQEFNFEDIFNIVKLLDSVVNNIVGSIKQTIESFRQLFDSTSDLSFPKIIQRFADAFDDIPFKIDDLRAIGQKAIQTIGEIVDPPDFITAVSNVIRRVTALVTDIKTDVTKFYDSIADAITVTLPWAIEQIKEAVNMVVNTLKNLFKSPLSALGDIQKAILKIQLAISSVFDAKKRIEDACLFTKGQRPYWFDIKSVITEIWEDVLTAKDSVLKAFEWFNGKHSGDEIFKEFTGVDANVIRQQIKDELLSSLDIFISGPLQVIQELAAPFVSTYESVVKTINAVKTGYTTVKQAYTAARTLISKIFGPKIHKDFPKKLLESDNCGNGFYPSTARGRYRHRGVDLEVSTNAEIVVPFTGDVSVTAANEISIVADELDGIEIILSSISLNSGKDGMKRDSQVQVSVSNRRRRNGVLETGGTDKNPMVPGRGLNPRPNRGTSPQADTLTARPKRSRPVGRVFKGESLGRATSSGCTPNSIHLAMRKVGTTEYIDPTRYLEKRIMPKPQWIQECDDYLVKLLFKVFAEGSLTKGPKDNDTTPARGQEPDVSGLQPIPTGNRKKRDIPFITALQQRADDFTDRLGLPRISEIGPILAGFNIKDIKVGQILDLLETFGLTELKKKLENALNTLEDLLGTGKCVATETMDDDTLKLGLKARGKSTSGSRMSLIKRFKDPDEDLDQLKERTLQEIKELLDIKNPGSFDIQQLMKNLREAYLEIAKDALNNLLGKLFPGQFSSFDVCMDGVKIFGPNDITFFRFTFNFFLGPVPMQFAFSAGGSWKVECGFKLCFLTMKAESGSGSGKRSSATSQCTVYQLRNRDYTEPAFQLAIAVEDDRSEVDVSYSVGSFQGGSDLAKDEVLGGPSAVVEQVLPGRIPLYFTVKGTNSAGGTASVTCQLSSYDTTPPAGRVIPDFFTTSHPNVLKASAMAVDETPLVERKEAIGFGRGIYGDQAFPWSDISSRALRSSTKSVETSLLQFTSPRLGKLMSKPHQVKLGHATPGKCASACLALPPLKCISFNYDYGTSGQCELLEEVEGHGVKIHIAGHFHYFERLGIGHAVTFNHRELQLQHGQLYYFNYYLKNQLAPGTGMDVRMLFSTRDRDGCSNVVQHQGYTNILTSQPVKVDFTPVSPGPIQNAHYDETVKEPCHELFPDKWENRCVDEADLPNHRYIIDGEGSGTVFNGHTPFVDVLYTRANKYVSANWDGFHDYETGIYGYTWSVGTEKCSENIHPHKDPHAHLFDESEWTHTGLAHPLDLEDGLYYVSVRAINKVEYGGPLATTVCHSTPYAIDNTEPLIHEVFEMLYDEETHVISASYNVSDPLSNIKEMHIGLGKSTRDTYILDWFVHDDADSVEFTHHIPDGQPTWLRIRAVNNVDLRTAGHGPYPILVDTTPPLAGDVYDGKSHGRQVNFQSSQSEICANWENFRDPDTGIADYLWGVGTSPGDDNVVEFKRLRHFVFLQCDNSVNLAHNATYYSTLYAFNRGHKRLNVSANSEGDAGWLKDGDTIGQDLRYSSSPATVSGNWGGFTDPESGIQQYTIAVLRKPKHQVEDEVIHESESVGLTTSFRWHHFHLHQGDQVFVNLNVTNRALGVTTLQSDGFVLDLTPPVLKYLRDGLDSDKDAQYSSSTTELTANWKFVDEETGVDYIELQVYQKHGGTRSPLGESVTLDGAVQNWTSTEPLSLNIGALYTVKVHAINAAGLTAVHETDGVLIDPTPPEILFIHAGVLSGMDDEELTNGFVVIANTGTLTASWLGLDGESGIDSYWIGLGTTHGGDDVLGFYSVGEVTDIILTELPLQLYENGSPIYYISVKAQNGAGAFSTTVTASPIKVVAADVSGLVFDGAGSSDLSQMVSTAIDVDYQLETTTVSLQFEGYESAQHGIIGYEWGVGTTPGADDIQPFTDMGIVAFDEPAGSGIAQILLPLSPSNRYFSSVRAITGAFNILESTSDGFGVDQSAPSVSIVSVGEDEDDSGNKPLGRDTVYQAINTGSLAAEWNIGDNESAIAATWFAIGFTPVSSDLYNITNTEKRTSLAAGLLTPSADGTPNMVTVTAMNNVGLVSSDVSPPVVFDGTPPERVTVACPKHISGDVPFTCSWDGINDQESGVQHYIFSLGVSAGDNSVVNSTAIYPPTNHLSIMGLNQSFLQQGATFYATVIAVNRADLHSISYSRAIHVDTTPPVPGVVVEVNDNVTVTGNLRAAVCNTEEECHAIDAVCQMSVDHIHVAWEQFHDPETDIARYEVAIGTASGRRDLQDFTEVPSGMTSYVFTQLDLLSVGQVFATVRGYNGAGQFALALSNGVFISRLSAGLRPLEQQFVYDGDNRDTDMDFQASSEQLSASWSFGDPCPMVKYDWSIHRMDDQTFGDNSNIKAKDGESFYVVVRGTNQLGDSFVLRSDGISVRKEPLIPGEVRDGPVLGLDQNFQLSITTLSANWDQFGIDREVAGVLDGNERSDLEINKHQAIDHYEVAVGSDRRYASTRSNIVPFTNVGRNRTVTMLDLPLTPRATYYITVRGYSLTTSTTDVTSNGIQVGVGSEVVSRGKVNVERYELRDM
ncbi:hypothetical protein Bbelb_087140 [Branchiostoma belcheri]|nr:hypothetical protein Bbelb_087140 [Branchiostoma belcheri]